MKLKGIYTTNQTFGDPKSAAAAIKLTEEKLSNMKQQLNKYLDLYKEFDGDNATLSVENKIQNQNRAHRAGSFKISKKKSNEFQTFDEFDEIDNDDDISTQETTNSESSIGRAIVIYDYKETGMANALSITKNEKLTVLAKDDGNGWTLVSRDNGDIGYVPTDYIDIEYCF